MGGDGRGLKSADNGCAVLSTDRRGTIRVEDYVVSDLIAKRAELAGIIHQLQRQLDQYRADLTHIDGVLRILAIAAISTTRCAFRVFLRLERHR